MDFDDHDKDCGEDCFEDQWDDEANGDDFSDPCDSPDVIGESPSLGDSEKSWSEEKAFVFGSMIAGNVLEELMDRRIRGHEEKKERPRWKKF